MENKQKPEIHAAQQKVQPMARKQMRKDGGKRTVDTQQMSFDGLRM